jgi:surface protein
MNDTASKLSKILETKAAIKKAIVDKGVEVGDDVVFADYPTKIAEIEAGSGEVANPYYEELFNLRTSNGTDMRALFYYCLASELDLRGLDVSTATNMSNMFGYCNSNVNVEGWDTSKVTSTEKMFNYFTGSINLSNLDFSSVTNASNMFNYASINGINLTGLSFPKATSFYSFFSSANGDSLDLSSWDISNITNMTYMFNYANIKKIDLTNWKTTNVTDMGNMFQSYSNDLVELIIPDWDMTNTTRYTNFFNSGSNSTKGLMLIDLSRSNDITITKIASTLPTRTITTFGNVIIPADSSQDAINALITKYWKPVGPRLDMTSTELATELDEIKPGESTKLCYGNSEPWYGDDTNVEYVSSDETVATIDKETMTITSTGIEGTTEITARIADTQEIISVAPITLAVSETDNYPNVIKFRGTSTPTSYNYISVNGAKVLLSDMNYNSASGIYTYDVGAPITKIKFNGTTSSGYGNSCTDLIKINTNDITSMSSMFWTCKLTSLDLSSFNTSNVIDMNQMFDNCSDLTTLKGLSNFDTSQVSYMNHMFYGCQKLESLDLSSFRTLNVTNMSQMFNGCKNLKELNLSNFDMSNVTNHNSMFTDCFSLHTLKLDGCEKATIEKIISTVANFPTGKAKDWDGVRKIYCNYSAAYDLTPPKGWVFAITE